MEKSDSSQEYLFKNIRYYVVGELPVKTKDILAKAKSESYLSALATHVIVTDPDHYEVESARDIWLIPIVTPLWVELSFKCNTLLPANAFSPTKKQLFSGLVFTFSNIGKLDKSVLWSLITYNGGKCQAVLNKHCTHLVSPTPSGAKYEESLKHNESININR
uniref:BRCT domain-containing protein n=1 Tax=Ciona savignyi TaxID=51511 RepID=H2ZEC0_CIOSA